MKRCLYTLAAVPLVVIVCAPIAIEVSIYEVCRRLRGASWSEFA